LIINPGLKIEFLLKMELLNLINIPGLVLESSTRNIFTTIQNNHREPSRVAIQKKFRIVNQTRSRPELNDQVEIFWLATTSQVATQSKILYCFHQAVYPCKFSEKFFGMRPISIATGIFFWIATGRNLHRSRPKKSIF
jgi:hypothetical protein